MPQLIKGAPVVYRLPKVSLFVPVHADVTASGRPWTMLCPTDEENRTTTSNQVAWRKSQDGRDSRDESRPAAVTSKARESSVSKEDKGSDQSQIARSRSQNDEREQQSWSVVERDEKQLAMASDSHGQGPRIGAPPLELPQQSSVVHARTTVDLTAQLLPAVQRGYDLAHAAPCLRRGPNSFKCCGALPKPRTLPLIATITRVLAAGLRALDEAEDFIPDGIQLEADLDVEIVASSHRTPVLQDRTEQILPHDAAASITAMRTSSLPRP